ncbi:MFS transporter [Pseudoalteromonas sp. S16_S37]|uniref:MFS transporter n=1 Tax=Pseudoalteromonas sp. S16_S37 TaxID=2720228 RepID=UPI0016805C4D|nr:MFS transporter [Pseudoalteromonas sp. S16_S37]MBD1582293.1 multidrug effflux MFS transporter [Pseudoalteromonas sp. S16_S37]
MVWTAMLLLSCSQLASQIFLPVLPQIANELRLSASQGQMMITGYFICLGLSQLVVGPLRDKYGDRRVFLIGQCLFGLGCMLCAMANSVEWFAIGRILQGLGAAAPLLISRTLLGALYQGKCLQSALNSLAMVASCTAILSPCLGGVLADWSSWQVVAWLLAGYVLVVAVIGFWLLPKQVMPCGAISLHPKKLFRRYQLLLLAPQFIALALFKWGPTFIYLTIQLYYPFVLQSQFALTQSEFGQMMMLPMGGLLLGSMLTKYLQHRYRISDVMALFWPLLLISAMCFVALPFTLANALLGYGLVMMVFGGYFSLYMGLVTTYFREQSGSANALIGAIELLLFTLLAVACNAYFISVPSDIAWLILGVALLLRWAWGTLFLKNGKLDANSNI